LSATERPQQGEVVCSGCGKVMPSSAAYCSNCGKKLAPEVSQEETKAIEKGVVIEEAWPMLRHDSAGTGSDGSSLQAPLEKAWEFQASGDIESPLAAAYGMVFFGCKDKCVYAVDAASGLKRWMFETGGGVAACPVVADKVVYVASKDKNIYAIDAQSGQKRWQFSTREEISTPAVAYGTVFFGCNDKNIYALDTATGQKKWEFKSDFKDHSAPTPFEGKVLISGSNKKLFALDAANGAVSWELKDYRADPYAVAISGDRVAVRAPKGHFALIDIASGKDLGQLAGTGTGAVARSGDFVFIADKLLHGLHAWDLSRPTTKVGWDWIAHLEEGTVSAPAAGGDFVFIAAIGKKKLYGINIRKFMKRWEFSLDEDIRSSPVVANGMMFVASDRGKIHAFRSASNPHAVTALEHISGETASEPKFKAIFVARYTWPNCCCLCCGPAEKRTTISKKEGTTITSMPNLPYCAPCYDKAKKLFGRERPGVEILKCLPTNIITFRNERYWAMFMEANRIR